MHDKYNFVDFLIFVFYWLKGSGYKLQHFSPLSPEMHGVVVYAWE